MFYKTALLLSQPAARGPDTIRVYENKAPTADDARLLSEVEKEAWSRIKNFILQDCKDNVLTAASFQVERSVVTRTTRHIVLFTLNGRKHEIVGETDEEARREALRVVAGEILGSLMMSQESCEAVQRAFPK